MTRARDRSGRTGVAVGFAAPAAPRLDEVRALVVASMVLDERAESVDADRVSAGVLVPGRVGRAVLMVRADTPPGRAGPVGDALVSVLDHAADEGFTPTEIGSARARIGSMLEGVWDDPGFWADRLARLDAMDQDIDDLWSMRGVYGSMTPDRVWEVYRRWHARGTHIRIEFVGE